MEDTDGKHGEIIVQETTVHKVPTTTSKVFDFNWADDVDEEFGEVCSEFQQNPKEIPPKQETQLIEGARYRYAPGASKRVPAFSVKTEDRRYEYEGTVPTARSQVKSPVVNSTKKPNTPDKPALPAAQTSVQKQIWGKPSEKTRKRYKLHNKPTPPVAPSYEYYEATAVMDSFVGALPNAKDVLERVDPPEIVEDLWADYNNRPPRRIFTG